MEGGHALDRKKFASIFVYDDRDSEASGVFTAIESVNRMVSYFKGVNLGIIHGTGGDNLNVSDDKVLLEELEKLVDSI